MQESKALQKRERYHLRRLQHGPASPGKLNLVFLGDSRGLCTRDAHPAASERILPRTR